MTPTATTTACPDASILAQYVSGSLAEVQADGLVVHLESCAGCQQQIDQMARRADGLVAAMRRPVASSSAQDSRELDRLITAVKKSRDVINGSTLSTAGRSAPVTLDRFIHCLSKSGLSDSAEISDWVRRYQPSTSVGFANQLLNDGKLTLLQARALLRGRWRQLILGKFVVLEMLGQGGMSRVYRARHAETDREVCIKLLHPKGPLTFEHKERFACEIKTIMSLEHPSIVVAHEAGESESIPFLVMELLDGSDLGKIVATQGPLPVESAIRYLLQAAKAIAYAHSRGVIHRDIKPHNLFLDGTGKIKVLDLGLARIDSLLQPEDESHYSTMTKTGMVVGTVDYIAPEQALDARNADFRSDIYSLGCTLHYLLIGRAVYSGETLMTRLVAHREEPVPDLTSLRQEISPELNAVFQRMVAKCPTKRYQSMIELATDLESLLAGASPVANWEPPVEQVFQLESVQDDETIAGFDAPTLEFLPSLPPQPVLPRAESKEFLIPDRALLWSCIAGGTVAAVVLLFIVVSSFMPDLPAITLSNQPRAVVVVAPDGFRSSHYRAVTKALKDRDIPFLTASTAAGNAKADDGSKLHVDLTIADYTPQASDAVIVCGGNVHALKKTDLVERSLKSGAVVMGVSGDGFAPLHSQYHQASKKAGMEWDATIPGGEVIRAGNGFITKACNEQGVPTMVDHVFDELVAK